MLALAQWACDRDPGRWRETWRPYLEGHDVWSSRLFHACRDAEALEALLVLLPFVRLGLQMTWAEFRSLVEGDPTSVWPQVVSLTLHVTWVQGRGDAVVLSPHLDRFRLERLVLNHCNLADEELVRLVSCENVSLLRTLDLSRNALGAEGVIALASALSHITALDLDWNHVGALGVKALADAPSTSHLQSLSLSRLQILGLDRNKFTVAGNEVLRRSAHLSQIPELSLSEAGWDVW